VIHVVARHLVRDSSSAVIRADGDVSAVASNAGPGGGSGGSIYLELDTCDVAESWTAALNVRGGAGAIGNASDPCAGRGGGGGGGRALVTINGPVTIPSGGAPASLCNLGTVSNVAAGGVATPASAICTTRSRIITPVVGSPGSFAVRVANPAGGWLPHSDADGIPDAFDGCPTDTAKVSPGFCGCGLAEVATDGDGDNTADCGDGCPDRCETRSRPGGCGCGIADTDSDGDNTADCNDGCPADAEQGRRPASAAVAVADTDSDGDNTADCVDGCPDRCGQGGGRACVAVISPTPTATATTPRTATTAARPTRSKVDRPASVRLRRERVDVHGQRLGWNPE
jgi:hypothetical protein